MTHARPSTPRRPAARLLVPALTLLAGPALALAAEGPASPIPKPNEGIMTAIAAVLVFFICAVVLGTQVWPKIAKGLADREAKIRSEIEAAEAARAQAKMALDSYEREVANARAEAQKLLEKAREQQQAQFAELKARNDAELTLMREKALREIEAAKKVALSEIYAETAGLATAVAGRILQREVGRGDNDRLVAEAVGQLRGSAGSRN